MASDSQDWEYQLRKLRKYLLLLASLAATVTYVAGLHPPGGSWAESDVEKMAVAGDSILRATHHGQYLAFYYSNATAFAASLIVILLLLVLPDKKNRRLDLCVLQFVMVLDLLALMVAYTAGSCRDKVATIYTVALVAALSAYAGFHIFFLEDESSPQPDNQSTSTDSNPDVEQLTATLTEQLRKVLMLLSIFAATITYNAGLNPPGGFWEHANVPHLAGEVILKHKHDGRFAVFFFCNTTAFITSVFTVVLLLDKKLTASPRQRLITLYGFALVTMVTLVAAYAAGSCRNTATTTYTVALVAAVFVSIFLAAVARRIGQQLMSCVKAGYDSMEIKSNGVAPPLSLKEKKSLVLLLGSLAASVTYQAGLNPPGGVWLENQSGSHGHNAGDPILLSTDEKRYSIFFCWNSTAFVASIVVILMVQIKPLLKQNALHATVIIDLLGLMGAYIAGSSRTLRASIHLSILAVAFLVYVAWIYIHVIRDPPILIPDAEKTNLKKRRKRLLLFAILMAAITYQAGLNPPGGFWREEQGHSSSVVGSPILEKMYPRRYQAFFYCNAISFMASIALIFLLQNNKTYKLEGIRSYGLYACMLVGMLDLMGAYAAGTARKVKTSIYVLVLAGGVSVFVAVLFALFLPKPEINDDTNSGGNTAQRGGDEDHRRRKHVMLLAMLAAIVTYQAGLDPPGGVWPDGYAAGSPVLHDSNLRRYHAFFYSNSSSFLASIVVIILLLRSEWLNMMQCHAPQHKQSDEAQKNFVMATNIVVALDLVGLLVAYAAGSSRTVETSLYVIQLVVGVLIYILVHVRLADNEHTEDGRAA